MCAERVTSDSRRRQRQLSVPLRGLKACKTLDELTGGHSDLTGTSLHPLSDCVAQSA